MSNDVKMTVHCVIDGEKTEVSIKMAGDTKGSLGDACKLAIRQCEERGWSVPYPQRVDMSYWDLNAS